MRIILIRHARAEDRDTKKYPDDGLRPLTDEGREEQRRLAGVLSRMGIRFDILAASPLVRARETAGIIAQETAWTGTIEETALLGYAFSMKKIFSWLRGYPPSSTVVCVGHEPDMSGLASDMLCAQSDLYIDFKKSAMMAIDFDGHPEPGAGTLIFFIPPRPIVRLIK